MYGKERKQILVGVTSVEGGEQDLESELGPPPCASPCTQGGMTE